MTDPRDQGFTLIELMISLGLFALIAVAGLALVDSVLGVQGRTEVRLDRLADIQRAMMVVAGDLDQVAAGPVAGQGAALSFTRSAPGFGGAAVPVRYALVAGALVRSAGGPPQRVLDGVGGANWRFFGTAWTDRWPPSEAEKDAWPRAVALELQAGGKPGPAGTLRRVIVLPARTKEAE
jgi:general secretion pathway protein J